MEFLYDVVIVWKAIALAVPIVIVVFCWSFRAGWQLGRKDTLEYMERKLKTDPLRL